MFRDVFQKSVVHANSGNGGSGLKKHCCVKRRCACAYNQECRCSSVSVKLRDEDGMFNVS